MPELLKGTSCFYIEKKNNFILTLCTSLSPSYLVLFKVSSDSPAFVIGQCVSVLLEKSVDPGDSSVPGVLQILQS